MKNGSKMAKRPLYDWLPRNSEIHNFSAINLTERQAKVLGLGLKFRTSLKPPTATQFDLQIKDFCHSVHLQALFADQPQDPDFNPRLYVPIGWNPPRQDFILEDKLFHLHETLWRNISECKPHWKDNLARHDRAELKELQRNRAIRVLPTDKNLSPVLLSSDWVKTEPNRHLQDKLSYSRVTLEEWYVGRDNVIKCHEQLMSTYCQFIVPSPLVPNQSFKYKNWEWIRYEVRIVLWEEFVSAVVEGNTFSDIRVKKDNHMNGIYVNTAKTGTKITPSDPFTEILPITAEKPNEHKSTTLKGEILSVNKVQYYLSCYKCIKKVTFMESAIVKCQNCHLVQKSSCAKQWYAQILFKYSNQTVDMTLFVDCIKKLIHQLPQAVDIETMTETSLAELLLSLPPTVEVIFHNRSKVLNTIIVT